MPKINEYKEHMVMPCAYFFIEGMEHINLHKFVVNLEYVESDYKSDTLSVVIEDKDYQLISQTLKGKKVYSKFGYQQKVLEFSGHIAKVSPSFKKSVAVTLFCMDGSYRLSQVEKSRTWTNCRRCDVARKIAIENGLTPVIIAEGKIQEKISQVSETDMQFLQKLAEEETKDTIGLKFSAGINQIMYIAKVKGEKLYFHPRNLDSESLRTLWYNINDCSIISLSPNEVTSVTTDSGSKAAQGLEGLPEVNDANGEISGINEEEAHLRKFHGEEIDPFVHLNVLIQQWEKVFKPKRE